MVRPTAPTSAPELWIAVAAWWGIHVTNARNVRETSRQLARLAAFFAAAFFSAATRQGRSGPSRRGLRIEWLVVP